MTVLGDGLAALLGVIVALLAPLAIRVVDGIDRQGQRARLVRLARAAAAPAGLAAAGALWLPAGTAAALLTVPYLLVAGLLGLHGAGALALRRGQGADLAMAAGLVLWPGGALWLLAHRAGFPLLGYPPVWVGLTAAHFHVAGAFLPLIVGRAAIDRGRAARVVALAIALGVPLTAAGIAGPRWLETATAVAMTCAGLGGAAVLLTTPRPSARLAGATLCASMVLAGLYAVRGAAPAFRLGDWDPLASMLIVHGSLNVVGVGLV
ncbi:MAG: YndJ family transporter, partial [Kofleriaceae bacterium]